MHKLIKSLNQTKDNIKCDSTEAIDKQIELLELKKSCIESNIKHRDAEIKQNKQHLQESSGEL